MSQKYPGGILSKTPPTVIGPVNGEGGSASGIWTLDQAMEYEKQGLWPKPVLSRELYMWGSGNAGALGLNNTTNYSSPVQVGGLITWAALAPGANNFVIANKTDGTLWSWGSGYRGPTGQGNQADLSSPKQVGALTNWTVKIGAGNRFSAAIKTDGTLWAWGLNDLGQLGRGNTTNYSSPVQVGALTAWSKIGAGVKHVAAIKTDGTLWAWGSNAFGALGLGNTVNRSSPVQVGALTTWSTVAAGSNFTMAIKTNGTLWAWGLNLNTGQLGLGDRVSRSSPVQVGALTNWSTVTCGTYHTVAIKTDGTLWAWGYNFRGGLGLGDTTNRSSPVQVGALTTWSKIGAGGSGTGAVKTDGTLWTCGLNTSGELGLGDTTERNSPVQVGSLTTWEFISNSPAASTIKGGITKS